MRARVVVLVILISAACSQPARGPQGGGGGRFDLEQERKALTLPPGEGSLAALTRVSHAAGTDAKAAWAEAHYLIDLFDWARFAPDPGARKLLLDALGLGGAAAGPVTDAALDAILVKVDAILARDRLDAAAGAARALLAHDRTPPRNRGEVLARMTGLKGIARGGGPLAANATLRLVAFCRQAFTDATTARLRDRPRILAYCLYPLHDSDPDPYFADDPARRPPEPLWTDLAAELATLEEEIGRAASRLAPLGARLQAADAELQGLAKGLLPLRRDPRELGVPIVAAAAPYDWTPLALLGDGSNLPADLADQLRPLVEQDGRGRVTLALAAQAPAAAAVKAAQATRAADAGEIDLAVGYEQQLKAPPGDYWRDRAPDGKVLRLGGIPFALDLLVTTAAGGTEREGPRATGWDPARASLGLHLLVGPRSWQLVAPEGEWPAIATGEDAVKASADLRALLAAVRAAYPDEDGLAVVPDDGATIASVVAAAQAALRDAQGAPLFERLALATAKPTVSAKGTLVARVKRRAAAKVTIAPEALADRALAARRCYLEALERDGKIAGVMILELEEKAGGVKVASGPKDAGLRKCIGERVGQAMVAGKIRDAKIDLSNR